MNEILKFATVFEKLAVTKSMQPADVEKALVSANLWGGEEGGFDPNSRTADKVFKIIDKYAPEAGSFKVSTWINVPNNLKVTIEAKATDNSEAISKDLTRVFGPAMTGVVKKLSATLQAPPDPGLRIKWLKDVGY